MITQYSDGQLVVSAHHLLTLSVIEYSSAAQNSLLVLPTNMCQDNLTNRNYLDPTMEQFTRVSQRRLDFLFYLHGLPPSLRHSRLNFFVNSVILGIQIWREKT